MSLLEIGLIALLATYRITFMLNNENGPADIFARWRTWIGVRYDERSNPYGTNWRAEGVLCFMCLSVWVGIAATLLLAFTAVLGHIEIGVYVLFPFAVSGGAIYLKKQAG